MKDKKSQTIRYYLAIILLLAVLSGGLAFGYTQLIAVRDEVADELGKLDAYMVEEKKIRTLLEEYSTVREKNDVLQKTIPDRDDIINVVEQIENAGAILGANVSVTLEEGFVDETGVVVQTESSTTTRLDSYSGVSGVETLGASILVDGSLDKVVNLIGILDEMVYYIRVNSIRITRIEDDGGVRLNTNLTISIFVKSGGTQEK